MEINWLSVQCIHLDIEMSMYRGRFGIYRHCIITISTEKRSRYKIIQWTVLKRNKQIESLMLFKSSTVLTTARGQFCRAYHSIEYKHICIPSPTNRDVQMKTLKILFWVRCGRINIEITTQYFFSQLLNDNIGLTSKNGKL